MPDPGARGRRQRLRHGARDDLPRDRWSVPEFAAGVPRPLGLAPQRLVAYGLCALVLIAVGLGVASA